jgi:glycosyltransferase involved in cell wall biosynthesis
MGGRYFLTRIGNRVRSMRVDLLTREYPPEVYGGAGVHVEYLARDLRRLTDLRVRCFGAPRDEPGVTAYPEPPTLESANAALRTMGVDLAMAADAAGADVVHSHTWYANLAGHVASMLHGIPHVVTTHSLEPLAAVEGRAARRGIRPVLLVRADRHRERRARHRRQRRHAPRRA